VQQECPARDFNVPLAVRVARGNSIDSCGEGHWKGTRASARVIRPWSVASRMVRRRGFLIFDWQRRELEEDCILRRDVKAKKLRMCVLQKSRFKCLSRELGKTSVFARGFSHDLSARLSRNSAVRDCIGDFDGELGSM
jgi:hypothetical protein